MNLTDVVVDYDSLVRAYRRSYNDLDVRLGGYNADSNELTLKASELADSCSLILAASKNIEVEGVDVHSHSYDGKDALLAFTSDHKFVFVAVDPLSNVFSVVNIFSR